jgi:hypothetical protein
MASHNARRSRVHYKFFVTRAGRHKYAVQDGLRPDHWFDRDGSKFELSRIFGASRPPLYCTGSLYRTGSSGCRARNNNNKIVEPLTMVTTMKPSLENGSDRVMVKMFLFPMLITDRFGAMRQKKL